MIVVAAAATRSAVVWWDATVNERTSRAALDDGGGAIFARHNGRCASLRTSRWVDRRASFSFLFLFAFGSRFRWKKKRASIKNKKNGSAAGRSIIIRCRWSGSIFWAGVSVCFTVAGGMSLSLSLCGRKKRGKQKQDARPPLNVLIIETCPG